MNSLSSVTPPAYYWSQEDVDIDSAIGVMDWALDKILHFLRGLRVE